MPSGTLISAHCTMLSHAVLWTGKVETDTQKGRVGGATSHTLNYLGSIYARFNRWKHLDELAPRTYAGGDALGTMDVWSTGLHGGLSGELDRDPGSRWVYENLERPLIPIILRNRATGIRTDPDGAEKTLKVIEHDQADALQRAIAYTGVPWFSVTSPKHLSEWLWTVEKLKKPRMR